MTELDKIILEHQIDRVVDNSISIPSYTYRGEEWGVEKNKDDSWHKQFTLTEMATTVEDAIHTARTEGATCAEVFEVITKVIRQV